MNIDYSELMWLDHHHAVSLEELAELSGLAQEELRQLVESGALIPNSTSDENLYFNSHCVISIRTLSRLKQDFDLEPSAFGLTLVFLERIRKLELQLRESSPGKFK
jgi:chaperone modulatory protein CbpM